jgi:hypothetical protein
LTAFAALDVRKQGGIPLTVSRASALTTADFISRAAVRATSEDPTGRRYAEAEKNLMKYDAELVRMARLENGHIGETTAAKAASSLCPLWPFC